MIVPSTVVIVMMVRKKIVFLSRLGLTMLVQ